MQNYKVKTSTKLLIYFYMLHNLRFFQLEPYVKLGDILSYIDVCFCLYFLYVFFHHGIKMKMTSTWKSITLFYFIFLYSIFNAYFQSGQDLYYGLRGIIFTYMNIGFFYYLSYKRIPMKFLIRLCCFLLISYTLALLISYLQYPNQMFGYKANVDKDVTEVLEKTFEARGVYRFGFMGGDYISLILFYIIMQRKKIKYSSFIIILLLVMTLLRGTRGPIVATLLLSIVAYIISNKFKIQSIISIVGISVLIYISAINIPFTSKIINALTATTESEINNTGKDNVRYLSFLYYTTEFNEGKTLPVLIGNGVPYKGEYYNKIAKANMVGLYENDIEYLQWYIFFGIVGLFALLYWGITFIRLKVPQEYIFIKLFVAYIFIVMILGSHFFREIPMIAMLSYMLYYQNKIVVTNASRFNKQQ